MNSTAILMLVGPEINLTPIVDAVAEHCKTAKVEFDRYKADLSEALAR